MTDRALPTQATAPTALVTGSTGFVGRALSALLLSRGWIVIGAARSRHERALTDRGLIPDPGFAQWLFGDEPPTESILDTIARTDVVFHLAGDPTYGAGGHYHQVNVEPVRRLVDVLRTLPTPPAFVFASSIGAQDRSLDDPAGTDLDETATAAPSSDYGRSKLDAERLLTDSGLSVRIARLGMVVGAEMRPNSHLAVLAGTPSRLPAIAADRLAGTLPLVHVEDAVEALFLLGTDARAEGVHLVVAANVTTSAVLARLVGRDETPTDPRVWLPSALRGLAPFSLRSVLSPELRFDSTRLRSLGWEPRHDWRSAVDEVAEQRRRRRKARLEPPGVTVITGACSGLGRAVALELAPTGRRLLLVDIDEAGLVAVQEELSAHRVDVQTLAVDLRSEDAAARISDRARPAYASELFLCAGAGRKGAVGTMTAPEELLSVDLNLRSRIALVAELLPEMTARHFGRIVLVSSSSAFQPLPGFASYCAANAGLLAFGESLTGELANTGVDVLTVCPGGMDTNFQDRAGVRRVEGERLLAPAEVARQMLHALDTGITPLVVGRTAKAMDMLGRGLPRPLQRRLWTRLVAARR